MNTEIVLQIIILVFILAFIGQVKQWLLYAVIEAEKKMGGGTGEIKLRYVYDKFLIIFPKISLFISFELFKTLVDEALSKAKELLQENEKLKNYVEDNSKGDAEGDLC